MPKTRFSKSKHFRVLISGQNLKKCHSCVDETRMTELRKSCCLVFVVKWIWRRSLLLQVGKLEPVAALAALGLALVQEHPVYTDSVLLAYTTN